MSQLDCGSCGRALSPDDANCPVCGLGVGGGVESGSARVRVDSVAVILALIFVFPLGLYLMWRSSDWSTGVKWGISGLFLPPLWGYFIWRLHASLALKLVLSTALVGLVELFDINAIGISGTALGIILVLNVVTLVLMARASFGVEAEDRMRHHAIERKLDACHELIAQIELSPLPVGSRLHTTYLHALDMREEGAHLLDESLYKDCLREADSLLTGALAELTAVSRGLAERSAPELRTEP
jgi:hypothetical protein